MTDARANDEAQIRALIDDQARAIRAKDIGGSLSKYAPDILLFDVVNPLRSGSSAVAKAPLGVVRHVPRLDRVRAA
jgi:ketosteroid isomerase-like protein